MQGGAPNFFVSVMAYRPGTTASSLSFVLGAIWSEIDRVPRPTAVYQRPPVPASSRIAPTVLPAHIPSRIPPRIVISRDFLQKFVGWTAAGSVCAFPVLAVVAAAAGHGVLGVGIFAFIAGIAFGGWWLALELVHQQTVRSANTEREAILSDLRGERSRRLQAYKSARSELEKAENDWQGAALHYEQGFDQLKRNLEQLKSEYVSLKGKYDHEYHELERNKAAAQLAQFLQAQFISDHTIAGIGPTREAVLRSNGIETAQDIVEERILEINGFGPGLTGNLLAWKQQVSGQFRFNAAAAISPTELSALVVKYRQLQEQIEGKMKIGLAELRARSNKSRQHLPQLYARIPGLILQVAQAKVDAQLLPANGS